MKRIIAVLSLVVLAGTLAYAGILKLSKLGPSSPSLSVWGRSNPTSSDVAATITAAGASKRNCINRLSVVASSTATVRLLDGGTTVYTMDLQANTPLLEEWPDEDMCGAANADFHVKVSTPFNQTTLGTQRVNYTGFVY